MTVIATVDTQALRYNLARAKSLAPQSKVLAMVKANAYGHGLIEIAAALDAADALAVARLDEALALRDALPTCRVVILSEHCTNELLQNCATHQLDLVLHQDAGVNAFCMAKIPRPINIWLKLDTGMRRLGLSCNDPQKVQQQIAALSANRNTGQLVLMSHFASAEADAENTQDQLRRFDELANVPGYARSLANSAAIMRWPASHFEWVRPGIMLYGASPFTADESNGGLRPVMTVTAPLIAVRDIEAGGRVGYNGTWQAQRAARIGTVGIGYGDGYPRHACHGTPVQINGIRVPLVGRVSMDMISVDLSDYPDCVPGDTAVLWGKDLPANDIAACADTIAYELFTSVSKRVSFSYETE